MATVLVVDDDKDQLRILRDALKEKGHTVETAATGRAAIERGMRMRPDFIITEWLLHDGPDGFRIAASLGAIHPETRAMILTRFPSPDVRQNAIEANFFGYLAQPVDLAKLFTAIEKALEAPPAAVEDQIAIVEYDESTRVVHANSPARELLHLPADPGADSRFSKILGNRNMKLLEGKHTEWIKVTTLTEPPIALEVFTLYAEGGKTRAILVPSGAEQQKASPNVRALIEGGTLSLRSQATKTPPPRALIIDADRLQRRLLARQFDNLGFQTHSTDTCEHGLSLLEADPGVQLVVIDFGASEEATSQAVLRIQDLRPEVKVVGTSFAMRKREFEKMGAAGFLTKPAIQEALKELLAALHLLEPLPQPTAPPATVEPIKPVVVQAPPPRKRVEHDDLKDIVQGKAGVKRVERAVPIVKPPSPSKRVKKSPSTQGDKKPAPQLERQGAPRKS